MADVRAVLTSWEAPNPRQDQLRQDFLTLALSEPDAAFRDCAPDHITASALVFSAELTHVALLFHPKFDRWLQMGGHCEPSDRSISAAALREAREESGMSTIALDPIPVWLSRHRVKCWPDGHHLDVQFLARAEPGAILTCSEESTDVRWFALDEVASVSDESVKELLGASLKRILSTTAV